MIEFIAFLSLVGMILGTVNVFNMIHKEKEREAFTRQKVIKNTQDKKKALEEKTAE